MKTQALTETEWHGLEIRVRQLAERIRGLEVGSRYARGDRVRAEIEKFEKAIEKMEAGIENLKPKKERPRK